MSVPQSATLSLLIFQLISKVRSETCKGSVLTIPKNAEELYTFFHPTRDIVITEFMCKFAHLTMDNTDEDILRKDMYNHNSMIVKNRCEDGIWMHDPTSLPPCYPKRSCGGQNWTDYNDHCYFLSIGKSWTDSRRMCWGVGADLVKIDDKSEFDFLHHYISTKYRDIYKDNWPAYSHLFDYAWFWIGLSDKEHNGQWRWVSDNSTATFTNWATGYPKNGHYGIYAAMSVQHDYKWLDKANNFVPPAHRVFINKICERDPNTFYYKKLKMKRIYLFRGGAPFTINVPGLRLTKEWFYYEVAPIQAAARYAERSMRHFKTTIPLKDVNFILGMEMSAEVSKLDSKWQPVLTWECKQSKHVHRFQVEPLNGRRILVEDIENGCTLNEDGSITFHIRNAINVADHGIYRVSENTLNIHGIFFVGVVDNTGWSNWLPWFPCACNSERGRFEEVRYRFCGRAFQKEFQDVCGEKKTITETRPCKGVGPCKAIWWHWSMWSACSNSCGPGISQRTRQCHGMNCVSQPASESKACKGTCGLDPVISKLIKNDSDLAYWYELEEEPGASISSCFHVETSFLALVYFVL